MPADIPRLAPYPSSSTRKALPPSQRATLYKTVSSTLGAVLSLPNAKRTTPHTISFLKTFVHDGAYEYLQGLVWEGAQTAQELSTDERMIRKRALRLAEAIAESQGPDGAEALNIMTLLDLALAYPSSKAVQHIFSLVSSSNPAVVVSVQVDLISSFIALLCQQTPSAQGLYGLRRVAACVLSFVHAAKETPEILRLFADPEFVRALKGAYEGGLGALATAYGGLHGLSLGAESEGREVDEWEKVWVQTKVSLLDALHIILGGCLSDLAAASAPSNAQDRTTLAGATERAFGAVFVLLESSGEPSGGDAAGREQGRTPFLDQPLLADYQQAYDLSATLTKVLNHQRENDARVDVVEAALNLWNVQSETTQSKDHNSSSKTRNPGALKILLRSSGVQAAIDHRGKRPLPPSSNPLPLHTSTSQSSTDKGKARIVPSAVPAPEDDEELTMLAIQVLDILPDTSHAYAVRLLAHPRFLRDPAKVIEALLEGTAPGEAELADLGTSFEDVPDNYDASARTTRTAAAEYSLADRHNVFDAVPLDLSLLRVGKAEADTDALLADREARAAMKADILRRAEALAAADEDDEADTIGAREPPIGVGNGKGKETVRVEDVGPEEDELGVVRVLGDGEDSGDEDNNEEDDREEGEDLGVAAGQSPETALELAYLRDPKLFDRDAATRKGKSRAELIAQTGWSHEQIEGWRIMLERNPSQVEKLADKHAFRGNEKGLEVRVGRSGGGRGRGGRGRGRGGGGGGRGGASGGGDSSARERAWKDKNKASRGNHNRKRGHDKKMVRAGAVAGPSA